MQNKDIRDAHGESEKLIKTYTVKAGDTLSSIAKEFYGDPDLYERIYKVNKTTIGDDPDVLKVGQELKIPPAR
jgi:nucleoid-associated protein YgaU